MYAELRAINGPVRSMPVHNKMLFQVVRDGGLSLAFLLGVANASNAAQSDAEFAKVTKLFESACPASLSERTFRDYYTVVGAKVQDANNSNLPFAVVAVLPGGVLLGTYYRKPAKCCVSMFNVDPQTFAAEMARRLNLQGGKVVQRNSKKNLLIFKPVYANRIISIDSEGDKIVLANICQSEMPGAETKYQSIAN